MISIEENDNSVKRIPISLERKKNTKINKNERSNDIYEINEDKIFDEYEECIHTTEEFILTVKF